MEAEDAIFARADRTESQFGPSDEVDRQVVLQYLHLRRTSDRPQQGGFDGAARHVARMEDATFGVAAFAAEIRPAVSAVLELHSPGDELGDARRSSLDDVADGGEIAEAVAGGERVLDVAGEIVGLVGDAGYPALRPVGVRFRTGLLRHDRDRMPAFGQIERKTQPPDAAADDDCLEMGRH